MSIIIQQSGIIAAISLLSSQNKLGRPTKRADWRHKQRVKLCHIRTCVSISNGLWQTFESFNVRLLCNFLMSDTQTVLQQNAGKCGCHLWQLPASMRYEVNVYICETNCSSAYDWFITRQKMSSCEALRCLLDLCHRRSNPDWWWVSWAVFLGEKVLRR